MCNPSASTLAQAGFYSSVVGSYSGALGSVANAISTRRTANTNAQLAEQQAADAVARGQSAEFASRLKTANLKGRQTAELAAHGVSLDSGSPLDVLTTTDVMGAADAATIRDNAAKEAWGFQAQAANYKAQAATANPFAAGIGSLLGSAGTVASKWYRYKALVSGTPGSSTPDYSAPAMDY